MSSAIAIREPALELETNRPDFVVQVAESIPAWVAARRQGIGSSDAGAIWGESSFSSLRSLYESKVNGVEPVIDPEWAAIGHLMEPVIAEVYKMRTGYQLMDHGAATLFRSTRWPWMCASLDREIVRPNDRAVLECKSRQAWAMKEWNDALPLDTVLQVQHALAVTGWQHAVIGVMFGTTPRFIDVERDDELIAMHVEKCRRFWIDNVVAKNPPPVDGHKATSDAIRRRYSVEPGKVVKLGGSALEVHRQLVELRGLIKQSEDCKAELENQLREAIGDAETGLLPEGGSYRITQIKESQVPATVRKAHTRMMFRSK